MRSSFDRPSPIDDLRAAERLSKSAFIVYRTLSRMAVAHGNGFRAKHATIAEQAHCSISTVQRALRELVSAQMVRVRANARTVFGRNYRISSTYIICNAARWCFSERLKSLAKLIKGAAFKPALKPVSVNIDRSMKLHNMYSGIQDQSIGKVVSEYRVTADDLSRLSKYLSKSNF